MTFVGISFPNGSHGRVGRTTWFRSGRYGLEFQPLPAFLNLNMKTENRDMQECFDTRSFLKPGKVSSSKFLSNVRQNNFDEKS